ncbi:hypothetical protein ACFV42_23060 [Streptomyces solisilvae]|uniref:hypothetical protein n=1 Tax=Streptomyces malaysiensis TaxID=92644 RepID=UPI003696B49B
MRSNTSVIPANTLGRNDRVVINDDELPYLVDEVSDLPNGRVRVAYSSGDVIEYAGTDELTVLD